jgi:putative exosortase-associated protein (TIGR04073 family)
MRRISSVFLSLAVVGFIATGCAGPERKFGRGVSNMLEPVRMGELRRSIEQTSILDHPSVGFTAGAYRGFHRSLERTFCGMYEVLTFPFPNHGPNDYGPIFHPENPVYPESYKPQPLADQMMSPDTALGFGGGDIAPWIPGSRFHVFDN